MKDLIILVPDKDAKCGIDGLLSRSESINIRAVSFDIFVHPLHDPGVYHEAGSFLRMFSDQYLYALVFLDYEGSGQENRTPNEISQEIKSDLQSNGWPLEKAEVIVFDPEIEAWIWAESLHVARALGWAEYSELKRMLMDNGLWRQNSDKPDRPKEAMEKSIRTKNIRRSSSIYLEIAQNVSLDRCRDRSFGDFKRILQTWFPRE